MTEVQWPAEWMRGVLEVCVLRVVGRGPTYGYAIAQALDDAGLGTVKGGTLYPLLARFEQAGLVEVEWRPGTSGPGRKYYTLTAEGRTAARRRSDDWLSFAGAARALLAEQGAPDRSPGDGHDDGHDDERTDSGARHRQQDDEGAGPGASGGDER